MGNDGGSIARQHHLKLSLNEESKESTETVEFAKAGEWRYCRLSNKPLMLPIVSDYKGHLYNKEALLEWLMSKSPKKPALKGLEHIKNLSDVVTLRNLKVVNADENVSKIICKYGEDEFGKLSGEFIYLVPCGDVVPMSSLLASKKCPSCESAYSDLDVITINPTSLLTKAKLKNRMNSLRKLGLKHNGTKRVKRERDAQNSTETDSQPLKKMNKTTASSLEQ